MDDIQIIKIGLAEIKQLQVIGRQTFLETFAGGNTDENMQQYLDEGFSLEKLTSALTNPDTEFYFALEGENAIGYLKINFGPAQTELKDQKGVEIERIYVLQEFYGKKVGQMLYDKALQVAKHAGAHYIWLGVWEKNPRAINFYRKNGFVVFDKHIFKLGDDEQTDIMMKLHIDNS